MDRNKKLTKIYLTKWQKHSEIPQQSMTAPPQHPPDGNPTELMTRNP